MTQSIKFVTEENIKLKKKLQEVDLRHEASIKELIKQMNSLDSGQSKMHNAQLQFEFMHEKHSEKIKDFELVLNLI